MTRTKASKYTAGDHKVRCDLCALIFKRSETRLQWDNLLACNECFSPKHPQLNIKAKADKQTVDIARPEPENDDDLYFYVPTADDL